ncbi:CYTH domain-containing protein [Tsukamurella soli]|uniref:CYTH domain-containing protein n=1 Tax=Tsukamurella soli TaxID=644556 RepID=A0ABP8JRJ4_9ACTN
MSDEYAELGDFEYERKFVVAQVPVAAVADPTPALLVQAYLFAGDGYAVRVRIQAPAAALAVGTLAPAELEPAVLIDAIGDAAELATMGAKGPAAGGTRYEAEREIDPLVAGQIIRRSEHVVAKRRYALWLGEDGWVIDEFLGADAPLVVAEVERGGPVTDLLIPDFCVTEVSEDDRFRNETLAYAPYSTWCAEFEAELHRTGPSFMTTLGRNRIGPA